MLSFILPVRGRALSRILYSSLVCFWSLPGNHIAKGESATWQENPVNNDWYTAGNWTPASVPNGASDIATFGQTTATSVILPPSSTTVIDSLIFGPTTPYPLFIELQDQASLTFEGGGLINNSGSFVGIIIDLGANLALEGDSVSDGYLPNRGTLEFRDNSRSIADITSYGGDTPAQPAAVTTFSGHSAAEGSIIVNASIFDGPASQLYFTDFSTANQATVDLVYGDTVLDISQHQPPGLRIHGLSGSGGIIYLGTNNLTITNELAGDLPPQAEIVDGGVGGGTGGSLTKIGEADDILSLFGPSTYTGGTFIKGGTLFAETAHGSATGTGPVFVNAGSLSGGGKIFGSVRVGTGTGTAASLSPGHNEIRQLTKLGTLTIHRQLSFASDGVLEILIDTEKMKAANVSAGGVTIDPGANTRFKDVHHQTVAAGTEFTLIENTTATPIAGTFKDLPDGSMIRIVNNTYQINYEGGDGNDLTLTVQ